MNRIKRHPMSRPLIKRIEPMRNTLTTFITVAVLAMSSLSACKNDNDARTTPGPAAAPPAAKQGPTHAPSGVQPGSHEDWCGEHQVPESMCTRCNASLIPAFKATQDWCKPHGLPESQCLICNPQLKIERPPRTDGATP